MIGLELIKNNIEQDIQKKLTIQMELLTARYTKAVK